MNVVWIAIDNELERSGCIDATRSLAPTSSQNLQNVLPFISIGHDAQATVIP